MATLIVVLGLIVGIAAATRTRRSTAPPPFPCIATAKSGWLTAVTGAAMLRLEWGEGAGRVGVSAVHGVIKWEDRGETQVRALAMQVLEPISAPIRSNTADGVSLFAGCEGVGTQWRGASESETPSYSACLRASPRLDCLRSVFRERGAVRDEAAGAVSDRITSVVTAAGIPAPLPTPRTPWTFGHVPHGPYTSPGLLDDALDRVLPPEHEY